MTFRHSLEPHKQNMFGHLLFCRSSGLGDHHKKHDINLARIDAVAAWTDKDTSVTCCDCAQPCEIAKCRLLGKQTGRFRCLSCNVTHSQLYKGCGAGMGLKLQQLPQDKRAKFFLDARTMNGKELTETLKSMIEQYELFEQEYTLGGEFKPLDVWASLGYDRNAIETKSLPRDVRPDRMFGTVYRVPVLTVLERGIKGARSGTTAQTSDAPPAASIQDVGRTRKRRRVQPTGQDAPEQDVQAETEVYPSDVEADGEAEKAPTQDDSSSTTSSSSSSEDDGKPLSKKDKKKKKLKKKAKKASKKAAKLKKRKKMPFGRRRLNKKRRKLLDRQRKTRRRRRRQVKRPPRVQGSSKNLRRRKVSNESELPPCRSTRSSRSASATSRRQQCHQERISFSLQRERLSTQRWRTSPRSNTDVA